MALHVKTLRKPNRRRIMVMTALLNIAPTAVAKVIRPDSNGVMPKPT